MKNITLAMVTVLAAVAMLSAVLAVPMQQASAEKDGKDSRDGKDGNDGVFSGGDENSIDAEIRQENDCGGNENAAVTACTNANTITNIPAITLSDTLPDMMLP